MKKQIATLVAMTTAISLVSASVIAHAATNYYSTNISVQGQVVSSPEHITGMDNGNETAYLPVFYLQTALHSLGIQSSWDGGTLNLTPSQGMQTEMSDLPASQSINASRMAISINGTVVEYGSRQTAVDPAGGALTTYVPVYYMEQALNRLGIQSSWDGTNWNLTYNGTVATATKLDVVKAFAAALGIASDASGTNPYTDVSASDWGIVNAVVSKGYFSADSATQFGSADPMTAEAADHAYQLYCGIPDSHMSWNAGGNTLAWGNDIQLNNGVSTTGNLMPNDVQAYQSNLTNLNRGYSQNSNGSLQLWFKPYDAYTVFTGRFNGQQPYGNASFVSSTLAHTIQMTDDASISQDGSYIVWKIDGVPELTSSNQYVASVQSDENPEGNYTGFSFNGGVSWSTATGYMGYDSTDPNNGGRNPAVNSVWIKAENHSEYDISYYEGKYVPTFTDVNVTPNPNGIPTIVDKAGQGQY